MSHGEKSAVDVYASRSLKKFPFVRVKRSKEIDGLVKQAKKVEPIVLVTSK